MDNVQVALKKIRNADEIEHPFFFASAFKSVLGN
jgi:hypothetical protein